MTGGGRFKELGGEREKLKKKKVVLLLQLKGENGLDTLENDFDLF